jgi:glutaryl-CoA dehydrogenase
MTGQGADYYAIEELLSNAEKSLRDSVREFMEKEVAPLVTEAFHQEKPLDMKALAPRMGELGLIGSFLPLDYGGKALNYTSFGLICQEAERVDTAVRGYIANQSCLVMYTLWQFGSEEQKQRWLTPVAKGEKTGCFALTEAKHGSDAASIETVASQDANGWLINGEKYHISDAPDADFAIIWAQTGDGIRGFIVERGVQGFTQTPQSHKGAIRAGDLGRLTLQNCRIPAESILPGAKGLSPVLTCLDRYRFGIAWGTIGCAMDCYEVALKYAMEREQFGTPLAAHQLVQEKLVTMLTEITKGQLLAHRLGRLMDEGEASYAQISMAKKNNVYVARLCARTAREILGANGISLRYSPLRHLANIEAVHTYQGTDDIHTLIIGNDITGFSAFRSGGV